MCIIIISSMRATHPAHLTLFYFAGQYAVFIDSIKNCNFMPLSRCELNGWELAFYGGYRGSQNSADCRSHTQTEEQIHSCT